MVGMLIGMTKLVEQNVKCTWELREKILPSEQLAGKNYPTKSGTEGADA